MKVFDFVLLYRCRENLNNGMYKLMCGFWSFWPISGPVLDELMAKSEVERKCTDLQDGAQSKRKNYYSKLATLCYMGSNWYQIKPIRSHVLSEN